MQESIASTNGAHFTGRDHDCAAYTQPKNEASNRKRGVRKSLQLLGVGRYTDGYSALGVRWERLQLHFITCTFASEEMEDRYNGSMHSRRLSEQRLYMKAVRRAVVLLASSLCALDLFPRSIQSVSTIGAVMFCLYAVPVTSKGSAASRRAPGQPRQAAHMEPYLYSHIHLACTFLFPLLALDLPAPIVLTAITMHSVAAPPTEPVIHGLTRFPAAVWLTAGVLCMS